MGTTLERNLPGQTQFLYYVSAFLFSLHEIRNSTRLFRYPGGYILTTASLSIYLSLWTNVFISNLKIQMMGFKPLFLGAKANFGKQK